MTPPPPRRPGWAQVPETMALRVLGLLTLVATGIVWLFTGLLVAGPADDPGAPEPQPFWATPAGTVVLLLLAVIACASFAVGWVGSVRRRRATVWAAVAVLALILVVLPVGLVRAG